MQPATLLELARRNGVDLPATDEEGLRRWFRFRDFEEFVDIYVTCSKVLARPEDFQRLVADFIAEQARQNVIHSEVYLTIGTHLMNGASGAEIRQAVWEATVAGERRHGVGVRWIPDIVRNVAWKWADRTVEWALDGLAEGVVGLGLSGIEKGYSNEPFRSHFAAAADAGLGRVVHAGEHAGAESIRSALDDCGAERIGHGVRAVDDPELLARLVEGRVPLEICPSSNLALGVVEELADHPFDELRRAGAEVTVSSDDPPLFGTTLTDEYLKLADTFGYGAATVAELAATPARHAFVPADQRQQLERRVRQAIARLREELGLGPDGEGGGGVDPAAR